MLCAYFFDMSENNMIMAKDVSAPIKHMTVDGVQYELVFNNRFIREVETVYDAEYHCPKSAPQIFTEGHAGMMRALYALFYSAARVGGLQMSFTDFEERFSLLDVEGVKEILTKGIDEALPKPEKN